MLRFGKIISGIDKQCRLIPGYSSIDNTLWTPPYIHSINKDMPDALKKMIVGHSKDIDTDGTYGHEMDGDQQRAAAMIDEAFKRVLQ